MPSKAFSLKRSPIFHPKHRMSGHRTGIIFLLVCVCASFATPQETLSPDSVLNVILDSLDGDRLSLRAAIDNAVSNATSLSRTEAILSSAGGSLRKERGAFDPQLFFNLNYLDQEQPTASFFAGASVLATQQTVSRSGLRMLLPVGTELELALNTVRLRTNSQFAFLNPEYDAFGSLRFRQPLLGGLWISARKQLRAAEEAFDAATMRHRQQSIAVRAETQRLYWDLYAAARNYAVQKLTRDRAIAFLRETELRAGAGLVGPNQVANAKTFLADQELQLLDREEQLDNLSDKLSTLTGARPTGGKPRFIPVDDPPAVSPLPMIESSVKLALANNLELQASRRDAEAARVEATSAKWQALPDIHLVGSIGGTGLSGNPQDVIFSSDTLRTTRGGTFVDAIRQVRNREFPNWNIGVEVTVPIGLRGGLGERDRMNAQLTIAEQRTIELARSVEERVRAAHREYAHGAERVKAARAGVEAAAEQVRIGMIEFQNGRSTAFELVRLGEDFALAQRRYSEALVKTAKAAVTLEELSSGAITAN